MVSFNKCVNYSCQAKGAIMKDQHRYTILAVDDTPEVTEILAKVLQPEYQVEVAATGKAAIGRTLNGSNPDLILLDVVMPEMDGFQTITKLKAHEKTRDIPVIFLTSLCEANNEELGLGLGAVDYIVKPFTPALLKARVKNHLELKSHRDNLELLVQKRTEELNLTQDVTIEAITSLAEYRDPETGGHIRRTQNYVRTLAIHLKDHLKYLKTLIFSSKTVCSFYPRNLETKYGANLVPET